MGVFGCPVLGPWQNVLVTSLDQLRPVSYCQVEIAIVDIIEAVPLKYPLRLDVIDLEETVGRNPLASS